MQKSDWFKLSRLKWTVVPCLWRILVSALSVTLRTAGMNVFTLVIQMGCGEGEPLELEYSKTSQWRKEMLRSLEMTWGIFCSYSDLCVHAELLSCFPVKAFKKFVIYYIYIFYCALFPLREIWAALPGYGYNSCTSSTTQSYKCMLGLFVLP